MPKPIQVFLVEDSLSQKCHVFMDKGEGLVSKEDVFSTLKSAAGNTLHLKKLSSFDYLQFYYSDIENKGCILPLWRQNNRDLKVMPEHILRRDNQVRQVLDQNALINRTLFNKPLIFDRSGEYEQSWQLIHFMLNRGVEHGSGYFAKNYPALVAMALKERGYGFYSNAINKRMFIKGVIEAYHKAKEKDDPLARLVKAYGQRRIAKKLSTEIISYIRNNLLQTLKLSTFKANFLAHFIYKSLEKNNDSILLSMEHSGSKLLGDKQYKRVHEFFAYGWDNALAVVDGLVEQSVYWGSKTLVYLTMDNEDILTIPATNYDKVMSERHQILLECIHYSIERVLQAYSALEAYKDAFITTTTESLLAASAHQVEYEWREDELEVQAMRDLCASIYNIGKKGGEFLFDGLIKGFAQQVEYEWRNEALEAEALIQTLRAPIESGALPLMGMVALTQLPPAALVALTLPLLSFEKLMPHNSPQQEVRHKPSKAILRPLVGISTPYLFREDRNRNASFRDLSFSVRATASKQFLVDTESDTWIENRRMLAFGVHKDKKAVTSIATFKRSKVASSPFEPGLPFASCVRKLTPNFSQNQSISYFPKQAQLSGQCTQSVLIDSHNSDFIYYYKAERNLSPSGLQAFTAHKIDKKAGTLQSKHLLLDASGKPLYYAKTEASLTSGADRLAPARLSQCQQLPETGSSKSLVDAFNEWVPPQKAAYMISGGEYIPMQSVNCSGLENFSFGWKKREDGHSAVAASFPFPVMGFNGCSLDMVGATDGTGELNFTFLQMVNVGLKRAKDGRRHIFLTDKKSFGRELIQFGKTLAEKLYELYEKQKLSLVEGGKALLPGVAINGVIYAIKPFLPKELTLDGLEKTIDNGWYKRVKPISEELNFVTIEEEKLCVMEAALHNAYLRIINQKRESALGDRVYYFVEKIANEITFKSIYPDFMEDAYLGIKDALKESCYSPHQYQRMRYILNELYRTVHYDESFFAKSLAHLTNYQALNIKSKYHYNVIVNDLVSHKSLLGYLCQKVSMGKNYELETLVALLNQKESLSSENANASINFQKLHNIINEVEAFRQNLQQHENSHQAYQCGFNQGLNLEVIDHHETLALSSTTLNGQVQTGNAQEEILQPSSFEVFLKKIAWTKVENKYAEGIITAVISKSVTSDSLEAVIHACKEEAATALEGIKQEMMEAVTISVEGLEDNALEIMNSPFSQKLKRTRAELEATLKYTIYDTAVNYLTYAKQAGAPAEVIEKLLPTAVMVPFARGCSSTERDAIFEACLKEVKPQRARWFWGELQTGSAMQQFFKSIAFATPETVSIKLQEDSPFWAAVNRLTYALHTRLLESQYENPDAAKDLYFFFESLRAFNMPLDTLEAVGTKILKYISCDALKLEGFAPQMEYLEELKKRVSAEQCHRNFTGSTPTHFWLHNLRQQVEEVKQEQAQWFQRSQFIKCLTDAEQYFQQQDYTKAQKTCLKAQSIDAESHLPAQLLGRIHARLGNVAETKAHYTHALEKAPENEDLKEEYEKVVAYLDAVQEQRSLSFTEETNSLIARPENQSFLNTRNIILMIATVGGLGAVAYYLSQKKRLPLVDTQQAEQSQQCRTVTIYGLRTVSVGNPPSATIKAKTFYGVQKHYQAELLRKHGNPLSASVQQRKLPVKAKTAMLFGSKTKVAPSPYSAAVKAKSFYEVQSHQRTDMKRKHFNPNF